MWTIAIDDELRNKAFDAARSEGKVTARERTAFIRKIIEEGLERHGA